jgi:hypothetical protein
MNRRLAVGLPVVYRGTEHPELAGQGGIVVGVLSPRLLLVALRLPDGRMPDLKVAPEDVGISEAEAAAFLRPVRFDPAHPHA